jgi:hypothetical protein
MRDMEESLAQAERGGIQRRIRISRCSTVFWIGSPQTPSIPAKTGIGDATAGPETAALALRFRGDERHISCKHFV